MKADPGHAAQKREADHPGGDELHDRDAEIAHACLYRQRRALQSFGEEHRGRRHERAEVAAAETGEERQKHQHPIGRVGVLHGVKPADERNEQRQRGEADHMPRAIDRHQEHVDQAQRTAGKAGHCRQPEKLARGELKADLR